MENDISKLLGLISNPDQAVLKEKTSNTQYGVKVENSAEKTLSIVAFIILICGIIATIIILFVVDFGYDSSVRLVYTIMVLLSTLITWSVMKVLANISITLKEIKKLMKK